MKKIITIITVVSLSLFSLSDVFGWSQRQPLPVEACQVHAQYGFPQTNNVQPICREGYFVGYDANAKIPKYVTYKLEPKNALGCIERTNAFVADQSIQNGPKPDDYAGTGYDKGHMAPDGDLSYNAMVEFESFLMTNMVPQAGSLNRGIWKLLETNIRGWVVQQNQSYTIYVGGIYNYENKKIGNGVVVPHGFYKIVINNTTNEVAGWAFPHTLPYPNLGNDLTKFRMPVVQIQQIAGVAFSYPKNAKELQPGQEWKVDYAALTTSKRNQCRLPK